VYISLELRRKGTVQFTVKYASQKFQSNLLRHTKSSAALITSKRLPDTSHKKIVQDKLSFFEDNDENRQLLLDKIEEIKQRRRRQNNLLNSGSDVKIFNKAISSQT